jgi:hypothetical protein
MIDRLVAFDSNVLTYFLQGNKGDYSLGPDDSVAVQRIAAVRLFLYCRPVIVPRVTAEASAIPDPIKVAEHLRAIELQFIEFTPDQWQRSAIDR